MAITAAVGDVYEVIIEGRQEGQLMDNVLHFSCVGADTDVDLHLILVLINCFVTNLLPVLSSSYSLERVRWKKVSPVLGIEQVTVPAGGPLAGGGGASSPAYVSAVVSKRTLFPGRSGRGRMYIPAVPEGMATISALDTGGAFWAGLLGFIACVLTNFKHPDPAGGSNIWDLVLFSRKLAGTTKAPFPAAAFHAVDNLIPVQQLGTTRSRKVGRGQ